MNEPSKVTKVLIDKIHGGRQKDSKFWQSEFSEEPIKEPAKQPDIVKFALYPLAALALCVSVFVVYNIYDRFFITPDIAFNAGTLHSQSQKQSTASPTTHQNPRPVKRTYTKPKPANTNNSLVTKKDLDRAINKALRDKKTKQRSLTPFYRVELTNGSIIKARSAVEEGNVFTIKNLSGLEFSMQRTDIKKVSKVYPE